MTANDTSWAAWNFASSRRPDEIGATRDIRAEEMPPTALLACRKPSQLGMVVEDAADDSSKARLSDLGSYTQMSMFGRV